MRYCTEKTRVMKRADVDKLDFNISEIYISIQGEGLRMGELCTFVRLHGCMLRCVWCDTPYALDAKSGGIKMNGCEIIEEVEKLNCKFIEFTGGEPLMQENVIPLITYFCNNNFTVAIETNGHCDISKIDYRVIKIMDIKCPDSKMSKFNNYDNIKHLNRNDEVKFVIKSRNDFDWARSIMDKYELDKRVGAVLFSPVFNEVDLKEFAKWIIEERLPVRLQLQIHKFIWGAIERGV